MDVKSELMEAIKRLDEDEALDVLSFIQSLGEPRMHTEEDLGEALDAETMVLEETEEQRVAARFGP